MELGYFYLLYFLLRAYRLQYGIKDMLYDLKRLFTMFSAAFTGKLTDKVIQTNVEVYLDPYFFISF